MAILQGRSVMRPQNWTRALKENLFLQFSVVSFVVMAVIGVFLAVFLSNVVRSQAIDAVVHEAIGDASGRLLRAITPVDLETPMTGQRYDRFDSFVRESIVSERTARVKLWAKDGTVIYADDPLAVGTKFPENENLLKALRGQNAAEIKIPEAPENERERFLGTLIEVYTPIIFPGSTEPQGVLEIYQYYEPTAQHIRAVSRWVLLSVGVGFLVLYGILVNGVWRGWQTIVRQRRERQKIEEEMYFTSHLASIGELTSGIAHELNNPLTSIIGFSELLAGRNDLPPDIAGDLGIINKEAQRAAAIVKNLLTFARKHPPARQPLDINETIQNVLALRAYEQKVNNIQVVARFADALPQVIVDGFQLQQVFMNLIINAEYFMLEAHGRGTLTVTTERSNNAVQISFADDGPGIPREILERIFDPFFTTKGIGKGTGLGLSICHGVVTENSGRIWAESEPGKGATFIVELPVDRGSAGTRNG